MEIIDVKIIFVSSGYVPGKTGVLNRLTKKGNFHESSLSTFGRDKDIIIYEYITINYKFIFFDTGGQDRFKSLAYKKLEKFDIITYLFDLSEYKKYDEDYIKRMRMEKIDKKLIYLVGNKLDIGYENVQKYRKKEKKLIDRGLINKYFEISAKRNEGIDELFNF